MLTTTGLLNVDIWPRMQMDTEKVRIFDIALRAQLYFLQSQ